MRSFSGFLLSMMVVAALCAITSPSSLASGKRTVVVELFTSQGCSSCPPADALLGELAKRDDVVALSLPIDYWDYLGWTDTLSRPAHKQRQKAYKKTLNLREVYTPQMIIGGTTDAVGSHREEVNQIISELQLVASELNVTLAQSGQAMQVSIEPKDQASVYDGSATVWFVRYKSVHHQAIGRGENGGKTLPYYNVVRDIHSIGMWDGTALQITIPAHDSPTDETDACAVLVQENGTGRILAAARLNLTSESN